MATLLTYEFNYLYRTDQSALVRALNSTDEKDLDSHGFEKTNVTRVAFL